MLDLTLIEKILLAIISAGYIPVPPDHFTVPGYDWTAVQKHIQALYAAGCLSMNPIYPDNQNRIDVYQVNARGFTLLNKMRPSRGWLEKAFTDAHETSNVFVRLVRDLCPTEKSSAA
jgi:hypothetical protein